MKWKWLYKICTNNDYAILSELSVACDGINWANIDNTASDVIGTQIWKKKKYQKEHGCKERLKNGLL